MHTVEKLSIWKPASHSSESRSQRPWEELASCARATHLADSALSVRLAHASRLEARQGHENQALRPATALAEGWEELLRRHSGDVVVRRLVAGAVVVQELRKEVEEMLGFTCSGGVASNKLLAKWRSPGNAWKRA